MAAIVFKLKIRRKSERRSTNVTGVGGRFRVPQLAVGKARATLARSGSKSFVVEFDTKGCQERRSTALQPPRLKDRADGCQPFVAIVRASAARFKPARRNDRP